MKRRKIKKSKPMFKKRRSPAKTVLNVLLIAALLAGIAFLGYSVGKPIVQFLRDRPNREVSNPDGPGITTAPPETEPAITTAPPETSGAETEPEPIVEEKSPGKGILYVSIPAGSGFDAGAYIDQRIEQAVQNGYSGIELDLVSVGGKILFNTANELAVRSSAVPAGAIPDLKAIADKITAAGLIPYARVSALTDHLASWDKSICYLFENSTSTWLDESVSNGGKPWISAFSQAARDYVSFTVKEISDAGFEGVIAAELEFPPFRNSDLNYIGQIVKSADRYKGLIEFSNCLADAAGQEKTYAVEVDAEDILSGRAEILKDPAALNCSVIYVRYSSAAVGTRISKPDGSEISYEGLSEADKLNVVFKTVTEALAGSGKKMIPAVAERSEAEALEALGYDVENYIEY